MAKPKNNSKDKDSKRKISVAVAVKYAEIPADILALKPSILSFFEANPQQNFIDFKVSGSDKSFRFYKLANGTILAELGLLHENEKTIVYDAVDINRATNSTTSKAPTYVLKRNLEDNQAGTALALGIDYLKLEYKDKPNLQEMMSVISVANNDQQYALAVMPHFAGENAEHLLIEAIKDNPKVSRLPPLAAAILPNDDLEGNPPEARLQERVMEALNKFLLETPVSSGQSKTESNIIDELDKLLDNVGVLDNKGLIDFKDILYTALLDEKPENQEQIRNYFVKKLIDAKNYVKVKERSKPAMFQWNQPKKYERKDEEVSIDQPEQFLEKFVELLDRSIIVCQKNAAAVEAGLVQRDLKMANSNIHKEYVFPYDLDETLPFKPQSQVAFKNETAPKGTLGYMSPYNTAVYNFIRSQLNTTNKARKVLAVFEVLNRLDPELKTVLMQKAGLTTDNPKGLENVKLISTMPGYIFNAKSDANSLGVILEELSLLSFKFVKYIQKGGGGLAQSIVSKNPKDEPYVALFNHFLLITKKLLNPDVADTYVATDAVRDLQELKKLTLAYEHKSQQGLVTEDSQTTDPVSTVPQKRPALSLLFHPNKKATHDTNLPYDHDTNLPYDAETTAAILNSFDTLAATVINDPVYKYKKNIPHAGYLPAGTSITVGTKIVKLEEDLYRLPNGAIVSADSRIFAFGRFSVVKIWTDIQTGERFAAKFLTQYSPKLKREKLSSEEKKVVEDKAAKEVSLFNRFYDKALGGKYKDKAQILKLLGSESEQLVILMPFLRPEVNYASQRQIVKGVNVTEERNKSLYDVGPESSDDESDPNRSFMKYFVDKDTASEEQLLQNEKYEKDRRVMVLLKSGMMDFSGDSVTKTTEEYKNEYLGKGQLDQFTNYQLQKELTDNLRGFIASDFAAASEPHFLPKENATIEVPLTQNFADNLANILERSKNTALMVQHAHDENIIITDLKDDNLLVQKDNTVLPVDFGGSEYVERGLEYSDDDLELKATLDFATPENFKILVYNIENYPHAVKARRMLALLEVLEERSKTDKEIVIPAVFTDEFKEKLQKTANIPQYKYNERSALYALGCTIEMDCFKNLKDLENDYGVRGGGLPKSYQTNNNDPRIACLNQLLKISKKLKNNNSNYTAGDAAKDLEKLQNRMQLSKKVVEQLKNPSNTKMTLLQQVLIPKTIAKSKAKYDPDREIWNNTAQSLAIELDAEKYEVSPQRDHSIKIHDKAQDKTVAILQIVEDESVNGRSVEAKLISDDANVIIANLRAIVATAEPNSAITLENYEEYPAAALQIQEIAEYLQKNEGLNIKIVFDAATEAAVAQYKTTPEYLANSQHGNRLHE